MLRAAVARFDDVPRQWPDLADVAACQGWIDEVWRDPRWCSAIRLASPGLAERLDAIQQGARLSDRQVRRAAGALLRYVLRATGRHTPFGVFSGAGVVAIGSSCAVQWNEAHKVVVRADTQWLAGVIDRLETDPALLDRLEVTTNPLAVRRGDRLELAGATGRVRLRYTPPVRAAIEAAERPIRVADVAAVLGEQFGAPETAVSSLLTELVRHGMLRTNLRILTIDTDPLSMLITKLDGARTATISSVAPITRQLRDVHTRLADHNTHPPASQEKQRSRTAAVMRRVSTMGRTPLAADLGLDVRLQVPAAVAEEVDEAATALLSTPLQL